MSDTWLECSVSGDTVTVQLQDGTSASLRPEPTLVAFDPIRNKHFLRVESFGSKDALTYVGLPSPTLEHGKNITVNNWQIKTNIITDVRTEHNEEE